ncbi:MAG TPA: metalloregulator ArsR/SmtB family transcription factor [Alcanivoracaceae bacterium]|nr:metalloregulator ArsR/SmtB family transcription factor [Alcanivoracaceae bacterium]
MEKINQENIIPLANYFKALGDPTRLRILQLLSEGRYKVGELAQLCGYSSANISRHLSLLSQHGLIKRQAEGTSAYYYLDGEVVSVLCELVREKLAL